MSEPDRAEVEAAFLVFWTVGNLDESWEQWPGSSVPLPAASRSSSSDIPPAERDR